MSRPIGRPLQTLDDFHIMKLLALHLSDIHIKAVDDVILGRADSIAAAKPTSRL
jgi:hypothetical protein